MFHVCEEHVEYYTAGQTLTLTLLPVQLDGHQFQVTRHAQCTIRVTVMEETTSGGHKIKVVGLAISDAADSESAFWHGDRVDWTYGEVTDRRLR